jgi:glycosyltransferase involved in cell wall biosynthesis
MATWNVHYISTWEGRGLARQLPVVARALVRILSLLLQRKVLLVHAHAASRGSFWRKSLFCLVARCFGVPYILHLHNGEFLQFFHNECGYFAQRGVRAMLERAARVIVLAETWRGSVAEIAPGATIIVIGNPVNVPRSLPTRRALASNVLFLGRLWKKKGVFDLVHAIPAVLKRVPQAKFCLAGDGESDALRALALSLDVGDAVHLPGWVDGKEKYALLGNSDVLVLPSYFEGLGICILEAMANGVPVVATRVGGIPALVENGVTGLLFEPGDIAGMAERVAALLLDAGLRDRLRAAAFERVRRRYAVEVVFEGVRQCYRDAGVRVDSVPPAPVLAADGS